MTRTSSLTLFSASRKNIFQRYSFILFLLASLGFLIMGKTDAKITETIRVTIIDATIPVIDFLARPIDSVIHAIDNIKSLASIREHNTLLLSENERLKRGYMKALQIEAENIYLRKLLSFVDEPIPNFVSARIVGDSSGPYARSAIINAGNQQHIRKGQAVVNDKGLVGRIIETGKRSSRILLLTDINSHIPIITSKSRERGIMVGNNSETPAILYLPEDTKVEVGETIMTSGDGDLFPPDQPIGIVYFKNGGAVHVRPFVEWNRLEYVSVVDY